MKIEIEQIVYKSDLRKYLNINNYVYNKWVNPHVHILQEKFGYKRKSHTLTRGAVFYILNEIIKIKANENF